MATTSDVKVTPGTGANVATYDITEDAETKKLQRVVLSTNAGVDIDFTAASPVSQSGTWNVGLSGGNNVVGQVKPAGRLYKACAASATTLMGATGAIGDVLDGVLIIPGTTSPGVVQIKDGTGTAITIFAGGASSVAGLVPFFVPLYAAATGAGWNVITNANVTAIGVGQFT